MIGREAKIAAPDFLVARQVQTEDLLLEIFKRPNKAVIFRT
jgi:hypothetical protein